MGLIDEIRRRWSVAPNRASGEMPKLYGQSPRLDPVRYIAKTCASEELKIYRKSDYRKNGENAEVLGEHELYNLLENPCPTFPELDGWTLRYLTFVYLDLVGECGWLKVRADNSRRIIALLPIPKAWILQKPTLGYHFYKIIPYGTLGGVNLTVPAEDFIYFKDVDPSDPYGNGKGLSESIADELETDEYASKYQKNFFFNDATPPYYITGYKGNDEGAVKLKKTLMERIGGFRKAREPAILSGEMDIKQLGISPKELDMVASRKFLRDECIQHYQLPPEIFGIVENSNRATIDASYYLTQKNVIIPRLKFFERTLNNQLFNEYDDVMCMHKVKVIEDEDLKLRIYQFGVQNGCITQEQFCEQFGINPKPEEGHYIMPISATRVSVDDLDSFDLDSIPSPSEEEDTTQDSETQDAETQEDVTITDEEENGKSLTCATRILQMKKERDEWKNKLWDNFDQKARSKEASFITAVKKIARKQNADIKQCIKDLKEVNSATVNNLCNDYFQKACDEAVKRGLATCWLESLQAGRDNAHIALNGKKEITEIDDVLITNELFNKWVERYGLLKSEEINQTSKKKLLKALRKTMSESIQNGDGLEVMKEKLQESARGVFSELSDTRSYLIARTETGASVNMGQVATYQATGIEQKEWIATLDDRTRDSHIAMDGQIADINMTFDVPNETDGGVDAMLYPSDPNGSAGNVCNCRCTVAPVVK